MTDLRALAEEVLRTEEILGRGGWPTSQLVRALLSEKEACLVGRQAAEQERDATLDRLAWRTADWNLDLDRAEKAEAALAKVVTALEHPDVTRRFKTISGFSMVGHGGGRHRKGSECVVCDVLRDIRAILEGREETP